MVPSNFGTTEDAGERSRDLGEEFLRHIRLQQVGSIFRQVCYVRFAASLSSCDVEWSGAKKRAIQFFLLCISYCWQHTAGKD